MAVLAGTILACNSLSQARYRRLIRFRGRLGTFSQLTITIRELFGTFLCAQIDAEHNEKCELTSFKPYFLTQLCVNLSVNRMITQYAVPTHAHTIR